MIHYHFGIKVEMVLDAEEHGLSLFAIEDNDKHYGTIATVYSLASPMI